MKKLNLKNILKTFKLNESTISTIIGVIVVVIAGTFIFNYFKGGKGSIIPGTNTQQEERQENESGNENEERTYIVKKGQSLWKIAEEVYGSGYNWVDIAKENNIKNPNVIEEGMKIKIPNAEVKTAKTMEDNTQRITGGTYTVAKGDTLWKIAVRAYGDGYRWVDIARENKLSNPNLIHSGNVLSLPR